MSAPWRPALRYFGGKWNLAPWITARFPPHAVYVEPFGGGASVLLRKPRAAVEVYNDLDGDVVNLFRVLQDDDARARLMRLVEFTPFAREEWRLAYAPASDAVERARRLVVRSWMGHGSSASRADRTTGLRFDSVEGRTRVAVEWAGMPEALAAVGLRMKGVAVENRPALDLIAQRDHESTLFYVDPPYLPATRSAKRTRGAPSHGYIHDLDEAEHRILLERLTAVRGMVVLSGYPSPLYDEVLSGWRRTEREAVADGQMKRTEVLWINPAADKGHGLFGSAA